MIQSSFFQEVNQNLYRFILDGINFAKSDDVMWLDADGSMTPLAMGKLKNLF